jgi:hypothetical protein
MSVTLLTHLFLAPLLFLAVLSLLTITAVAL